MAYWGSGAVENDYAAGQVGAYIVSIKKRMFEGAEKVIEKPHPEQAIIPSLQCLRLLSAQFPKSVRVHFGRRDFEKAKEAFEQWYGAVHTKIPKKYREAVRTNAEAEFELFERDVLLPPISE